MNKKNVYLINYVLFHIAFVAVFAFDGKVASFFEAAFTALGINTGGTPVGVVALATLISLVFILLFGFIALLGLIRALPTIWRVILLIEYIAFVTTYLYCNF